MKQKSLKINAIWNLMYTGSNLLFPLITAPYVSRVLGASNLGQVDFANSFVQWFLIFAAFGVTTYGVRAISQVRNNKDEMSKVFSELFLINFIFSLLAMVMYIFLILNNEMFVTERSIFMVMSFSIVLNAVNIDWFYQGIEEYSYITIRNTIVRIFSLISIFVYIKNPDDYVVYGFISILGAGLSGFLNVINSRKYIKFNFKHLNFKRHLKSLWTFFALSLIVNIYINLDKTMLGFLDTSSSVAYLTRAKMVTSVASSISTSISSVAMPRASYYLNEDFEKYKKLIQTIPNYMLIFTIPSAFGMAMLSTEIMQIFGGDEFVNAGNLLSVIAFAIIFSTLSSFIQNQVLLPMKKEKIGLLASIFSSIVSLSVNLFLIPYYSYIGAGIALLLAELTAFFSRYLLIRKNGIDFIKIINSSVIKYICSSLIMLIPVLIIKKVCSSIVLIVVFSGSIGATTYVLLLILTKEEVVTHYLRLAISIIKRKRL